MERKLGEVFDCNGVKLRVEKETNTCGGCYFNKDFKIWLIDMAEAHRSAYYDSDKFK